MTETPERPEAVLRFRADQLREAYDRGEAISPNDARLIEVAIRGVADGPPITRDDDYVREVQAVSELLMDFDPTDRFASISEHLADLLKRFAASHSAFSGIPRTENEESARIRFGVREVGTAPRRRDKWATRARAELELTRWRENNPSLNYELVEIRTTERALKENPVADAGPYLGCKPCEDDANV